MRVLLTGATGFLGKQVLNALLADESIQRVDVISRSKQTHRDPRVKVLKLDLSNPSVRNEIPTDYDSVIHLAGLYDFSASFEECYRQNVLPTLNLISLLKEMNQSRSVALHHASTYAVGHGMTETLGESPIRNLPSRKIPYLYTKALAEKAITDSGLPARIFRLGILVGESRTGSLEKLDGPYALLKALYRVDQTVLRFGASSLLKQLHSIPLPGRREAVLPLVPVDCAARVFARSLKMPLASSSEIHGVYHPESVRLEEFCEEMLAEFLPGARARFVSDLPDWLLKAQERVTGIPVSALRFATHPVPLHNPGFQRSFADERIPHFSEFKTPFLGGFRDHMEGRA